ncbi:hypothetical protein P6P90_07020 [Ectobacillus antri]|uniref:Uncharacterized protein n=1 Tax=Ectobacillus antri TaxID=2486280 RepID=A0ABT6H304_9BACI|nr:hypothetical protein [Ectobacillus antri]MDG4658388.1 hypothetical protein [Ectobacillus antri]MDG5753722.1 hypothetical protein [Ectobacillus antri]
MEACEEFEQLQERIQIWEMILDERLAGCHVWQAIKRIVRTVMIIIPALFLQLILHLGYAKYY